MLLSPFRSLFCTFLGSWSLTQARKTLYNMALGTTSCKFLRVFFAKALHHQFGDLVIWYFLCFELASRYWKQDWANTWLLKKLTRVKTYEFLKNTTGGEAWKPGPRHVRPLLNLNFLRSGFDFCIRFNEQKFQVKKYIMDMPWEDGIAQREHLRFSPSCHGFETRHSQNWRRIFNPWLCGTKGVAQQVKVTSKNPKST